MDKPQRTIRRRRREGKTDYKARFGMLKSGLPRIVVRKSNKYLIVQLVESNIAQDRIVVNVSSKDLLSYGWPAEAKGSLKSLGAGYLTGLLFAKKTKVKKAILDIGLNRNIAKNRIYAVLKGIVDGGIEIPHNEKSLPSNEMIKTNEKTSKFIDKVKGEVEK